MKTLITIFFIFCRFYLAFSTLNPQVDLYANFETIGLNVIFRGGNYPSQNTIGNIYFAENVGQIPNLQPGFPLTRVNDSTFTGSIFWLTAGKEYAIKLEILDPTTPLNNFTRNYTKETRTEIQFPSASKSWYVSPTGTSLLYNSNNPGSLKGGLDSVKAGQEVVLLGGTYYFGEYDIKRSGLDGAPITIRGENGQTVILDGSMATNPVFVREQNAAVDVWRTTVIIPYSNCLFYNGDRLYPYKSKKELNRFNYDGFNPTIDPTKYDSILNIGLSGYFRDDRILNCNSTLEYSYYPSKLLWVKMVNGENPNNIDLKISQKRYCFNVINKDYIVFKNLKIQYYGVWPEARGILLDNSKGSIISNCKFYGNNYSVILEGNSQNNTIQDNEFIDGMQNWDTYMMKATTQEGYCPTDEFGNQLTSTCHLFFSPPNPPIFPITVPTSTYYPQPSTRQMELSAITVGKRDFSGKGVVIRRNSFQNLESMSIGFGFNGTNGNYEQTTEMDIHENDINTSFDDGLEVDGFAGNMRFWKNTFTNTGNMFSLAPVRRGPVYMLKNIGKDFNTSRFFLNDKSKLITSFGSPLKFNCGDENNFCASSGSTYFINNTVYHRKYNGDKYGNGLDVFNVPSSLFNSFFAKNNVFITQNGSALNIDMPNQNEINKINMDNNMYFNSSGENFSRVYLQNISEVFYPTINAFRSASGFEINGFYENAEFEDVLSNNFAPAVNGNLVDRALLINGINQQFCGNAPDLGAIELGCSVGIKDNILVSKIKVFPVPNCGVFNLLAEENGHIRIFNSIGVELFHKNIESGNNLINLKEKVSSGVYFIQFEGESSKETLKIVIEKKNP
ncbi:MAG: T9SS type A sorting domain-containing protein [Bacteroidetes bacterium]|nr:T9SS type A sorting domain-containing protein [Bacteroidota bacterium]